MSTSKDSTMESATTGDADVIMNRINVALARSQRLINSWLPPKPANEAESNAQDSDEDFKSMTEIGGIGSKAAFADEGLPEGAFQRKKLSSNDKLLEQLLGKKAAQARKKSQEAGKGMGNSRHAAPKPLVSRPKHEESEDEGGRVAAFQSKKRKQKRPERAGDAEQTTNGFDGDSVGAGDVQGLMQDKKSSSEPDERPTKKKTTSYLDEVLAQKANKKSKNKKKHGRDSVS